MARTVLADTSALVALFDPQDEHHRWARQLTGSDTLPSPWRTCEAVLSEACFLLERAHAPGGRLLRDALRAGTVRLAFDLDADLAAVLDLMEKYADVPMSLADACLVRMSETMPDPVVLTTDRDFRLYRRHSRQVIPCLLP
jgi:uncharacterized protein